MLWIQLPVKGKYKYGYNNTVYSVQNGRQDYFNFVCTLDEFPWFVSESDECVENLPSFIAAFSSNKTTPDNIQTIKNTFYPQNKTIHHYVII